jgi:hypothetical protein
MELNLGGEIMSWADEIHGDGIGIQHCAFSPYINGEIFNPILYNLPTTAGLLKV